MRCFAVVVAGILMGSLAVFVRNISASPILLTFFRLSLGAIFLLPFVRDIRMIHPKLVLSVAIVNLATILCYIASIQMVEVATSALLLYMAPIYVTIYVWLRGEEVSRGSLIALPFAILGLYLMLTPYGGISLGIVFGILSGIFYAALFVMMKRVRAFMSSIHITFLSLVISSLILSPIVLILFGHEIVEIFLRRCVWILGLGSIPTALAFTIFNYGIKYCKTEKAPILALVEPVSAGIFGYVVFGEILTLKQLVGASLILLGIILAYRE